MNENVNGNRKLFWKEVSNAEEERWRVAAEYRMEMEGWY